MKTGFSTHFHIVRSKSDRKGLAPVFLRLTVDGKRKEFSITRRIEPEKWNSRTEKVMGNNLLSNEINTHINNIRHRLNKEKHLLNSSGVNGSAYLSGNPSGQWCRRFHF